MKKYVVRLLNDKGSVIDGEVYEVDSPLDAFAKYLNRCEKLGIEKYPTDKYSVEDCA